MPEKRRYVMRLYHGSNIVIDSINLAMCRPYKDFGLETTEEWAKFVMNNRNRSFTNVKDIFYFFNFFN